MVLWEPPEFINGVLQMYTVRVMRGLSTNVIQSSTVNSTEHSDVISGLETGSHFITVVALTGAGEGIASDPVHFMLTTVTISKLIAMYVCKF